MTKALHTQPIRIAPSLPPSTAIERWLVVLLTLWVPLDAVVPIGPGLSLGTLLLALLLTLMLLTRPRVLTAVLASPYLVPIYLFLGVTICIELIHPFASLDWWFQVAQMLIGAVIVAAAIRSSRAVAWALFGLVIGGTLAGAFLTILSWDDFAAIGDISGNSAFAARQTALSGTVLVTNLNTIAAYTAVAFSVSVCFALARSGRARLLYMGAASCCAFGSIFSGSRGSLAIGVFGLLVAFLLRLRTGGRLKASAMVALLIFAVAVLVPASAFGRAADTDVGAGSRDSRLELWNAFSANLGEVAPIGIGYGNFKTVWGTENGFALRNDLSPILTHNSYTQLMINWGWAPLAIFVYYLMRIGRGVWRSESYDELRLPCMVLLATAAASLLFTHTLYAIQFTLAFGVSMGTAVWTNPRLARRQPTHTSIVPSYRAPGSGH